MGKQLYYKQIHSKNIANLFVKDVYQHYYKVHDVLKHNGGVNILSHVFTSGCFRDVISLKHNTSISTFQDFHT